MEFKNWATTVYFFFIAGVLHLLSLVERVFHRCLGRSILNVFSNLGPPAGISHLVDTRRSVDDQAALPTVIKNALYLVQLSRLVYESQETVDRILRSAWKVNADAIRFIQIINTQVCVMRKGDEIIVSFRGTEPFNHVDWITDVSAGMRVLHMEEVIAHLSRNHHHREKQQSNVPSSDVTVKVHQGFRDCLDVDQLWQQPQQGDTREAEQALPISRRSRTALVQRQEKNLFSQLQATKDRTATTTGTVVYHDCTQIEVIRAMIELIGDSDPANIGVWITGHSLGGALAMLFAHGLLDSNAIRQAKTSNTSNTNKKEHIEFNIKGVYTFGQPRVGNEAFAARYNSSVLGGITYRFVFGDDMVPNLPQTILDYDSQFASPPNEINGNAWNWILLEWVIGVFNPKQTFKHAGRKCAILMPGNPTTTTTTNGTSIWDRVIDFVRDQFSTRARGRVRIELMHHHNDGGAPTASVQFQAAARPLLMWPLLNLVTPPILRSHAPSLYAHYLRQYLVAEQNK